MHVDVYETGGYGLTLGIYGDGDIFLKCFDVLMRRRAEYALYLSSPAKESGGAAFSL